MTATDIVPGVPAVARFPHDQTPAPAVVMVYAVRRGQALVAKHFATRRNGARWAKKRWIPLGDVARPASARETLVGAVIDPLPPRAA